MSYKYKCAKRKEEKKNFLIKVTLIQILSCKKISFLQCYSKTDHFVF